jgi:hypothetical protein
MSSATPEQTREDPSNAPSAEAWGPVRRRLEGALDRLVRLRLLAAQLEAAEPSRTLPWGHGDGGLELAARTREVLALALDELERLQLICEEHGEALVARPGEWAATAGIGHLGVAARIELQQVGDWLRRRQALERLGDTQASCHKALRRLRRALVAVARPLASRLGRPTPSVLVCDEGELESGVVVRRVYAEFRQALTRLDRTPGLETHDKLCRATSAIEVLLAGEAFTEARLADKLVLWRFRERIQCWRATGQAPTSARALYDDLAAIAQLLRRINLRESLRQHDLRALRRLSEWAPRQPSAEQELRELARVLLGLDDDFDAALRRDVLRDSGSPDASRLRPLAERLITERSGAQA